ncbi:Aste57867_11349 [Aphanomyces stellatus]|uniref:Aste57867_11349 protein n=1 Tax=Aphanomyces stellatus TaxID=120398 RepID=A0A485KTW9_9STRA|nr:hypothetical protein As57867_011307 [Aphanomyces stellatus]VFT88211.1 Aste57867_11349 [Aphanomyces stellatus]
MSVDSFLGGAAVTLIACVVGHLMWADVCRLWVRVHSAWVQYWEVEDDTVVFYPKTPRPQEVQDPPEEADDDAVPSANEHVL